MAAVCRSGTGGLLVCSATTGAPLCFLSDEHYLTDARTAAAGALATDVLATAGASTVGVLGAGTQAWLQVVTLAGLRRLTGVAVWARRPAAARDLAVRLRQALPSASVSFGATPEAIVSASHIVITATASTEPLIVGEWLQAGQHITALGADDDRKRELDATVLSRADVVVVDSRDQTCRTAELAPALRDGTLSLDEVVELGEVFAGAAAGRSRRDEITLAKLTGLAFQDLACAGVVLDRLGIAA